MPKVAYIEKRFSAGSLDVIRRANAVLAEYERQGYDLTLRQLYYQFVARGWIANKDSEYNRLGSIVNDARLAGWIDWDSIVDRTRYLRTVPSWSSPASIVEGAARGYQIDLWADQDVRIEVWIEKDALVGVIERACADLRVPFISCRGYTSQSEMWRASQRFYRHTEAGKRVLVLHLGDHDPSGLDMSRDIEERTLTFMANDYLDSRAAHDAGADEIAAVEWAEEHFTLNRLALNWQQVQEYNPPPNPAKLSDSRGAGYVERYGHESWELDALEPTVIGELIRNAVLEQRDDDRWHAAAEREQAERATLTAVSKRWHDVAAFVDGNAS